jgi:uncharacterized membrane protein
MTTIDQSIEVNVPVRQAYDQWTQFEEFPEFMEDVETITQIDDTHLHWVATVGGKRHEWDAVITEQIPDQRIAWRATSGKIHEGQVTFDKIAEDRTRVHAQLIFEPEGLRERMADALGLASAHVKRDLERFKNFVEGRGHATGAWRGEVHGQQVSASERTTPRSKRLHEAPDSET